MYEDDAEPVPADALTQRDFGMRSCGARAWVVSVGGRDRIAVPVGGGGVTWKPAMCRGCGGLPAVMGNYKGAAPEPDLFWCWECGTPCGDECCGVFMRWGDAERIAAMWAMRTGQEVRTADLGTFAPSSVT